MLDALSSAVSGMDVNAKSLKVNANNIANLNTAGFKASAASIANAPSTGMNEVAAGGGALVNSITRQMTQGAFMSTGNPLDMAIDGGGFFTLKDQNGAKFYSRDGGFSVDANGFVVNPQGLKLQGLTPQGALTDLNVSQVSNAETGIGVDSQGIVSASFTDGGSRQGVVAPPPGRVALSRFGAPQNLNSVGRNLYAQTAASGNAITGVPGSPGLGGIVSGALEQSNVDLAGEFVNMISAQRAFQANTKTVRLNDETTRDILDLKA